jgi:crotonobetainyl-CoA:carnitine CoA-transferase CaiB-like acyl-CoA transferase
MMTAPEGSPPHAAARGEVADEATSEESWPLAGVRVLDFTHVLAGPFTTRLLADFGADVLRVESSKHPDHPWKCSFDDGRIDRPAAYLITNRNKRSIAIDLKHARGVALAIQLARAADVVIENFSAGVMERLGLGDQRLRAENPRLIYVSMSGYGHSGPRRDWTSMNSNLQGYSGLLLANGAEDDPPLPIANSWNDYIAALHACFGILQALSERAATGEGRYLDLSQFECSVASLGGLLLASAVSGRAPPRLGNRATGAAPQGCYRCAGEDEWCAISVQDDAQWRALAATVAQPTLAADPRLATLVGRQRYHDEIDRLLEAWTRTLPAVEVERRLRAAGVPAERVRRIQTLIDEPDGATVFQRMDEPRVGSLLATMLPFDSDAALPAPRVAPSLGSDSEDALRDWLALPREAIDDLREQGVLV